MRHVRSALLLAGAALAAVSGCVTVAGGQRPEESGPPPRPSGPALPRRDTEPPRAPGPPREALTRVEDGPESPGASPRPRSSASSASAPARRPTARPAPRRPGRTPGSTTGRPGPDVCGLGEAYGGWAADGEPARTCRQVYGD
ncbi:hypothetical protein [Streptomyces sp. CNQ085]|uniref:hypothetical protein n=1 Tax=Streptomyces sp. CNQ085 TaxID=2886944 RepID=UPI001F512DD0|nr:hypothetical protein [Streptomyces sp. CNQ085]MCI0386258.1 hypothetical protein [Streptomyces sp. CNQ085]